MIESEQEMSQADFDRIQQWQTRALDARDQYLKEAGTFDAAFVEQTGLSTKAAREMQVGWLSRAQLATHGCNIDAAEAWTFPLHDYRTCIIGCALLLPDGWECFMPKSAQGGLLLPIMRNGSNLRTVLVARTLRDTLRLAEAPAKFHVIGCMDDVAAVENLATGAPAGRTVREVALIGQWSPAAIGALRNALPRRRVIEWGDIDSPVVQRIIQEG